MMMDFASPALAKPAPRGVVIVSLALVSWLVVTIMAMGIVQIYTLASALWN